YGEWTFNVMASLYTEAEREFARKIARINTCNPFLPERIAAERTALGAEFIEAGADWNQLPPTSTPQRNHVLLTQRVTALLDKVLARWPRAGKVAPRDAELHAELAGFWLYQTYSLRFDGVILAALEPDKPVASRVDFFPA